ncbi:hypothetical protein AAG570_000281 [Ranatra chinensis]|uniref:Glycogen debranching enzyme C-terminal domain-containing protein n=1 Tax=Ranatra chinensis TaxID=642074 RepID=A0ABD0YWM5_9HEMI
MRSWGRDTFISLRGLFLLTGRFDEARYHILGYGGCLRHGLIPNLLDRGVNARFNCRDATWWWLYTIKEYTRLVPNGVEILNDKVNRLFPTDDSSPTSVLTILTCIFLSYLGFVFGGNDWNCGTWMDKMGSSEAAGTRGKPATPRDGSAVEIVALCKSTLNWLIEMNANGHYPHGGVVRCSKDGTKTNWTWKEWAGRIQLNFEKMFWVGEDSEEKYVNRKLIYKDTVGATRQWADYQLRPNFTVAMVVVSNNSILFIYQYYSSMAPELFDKDHAWKALCSVEAHLLGPLGMRTLDPSDWAYCGYYDNTNNSNDPKIAHGYNYHQGPEWVWPIGYYLRAKLIFGQETGKSDVVIKEVKRLLRRHWYHLTTSPWRGLPELTNKDGAYCPGSCTTQAWSMATVLEVCIFEQFYRTHNMCYILPNINMLHTPV